MKTRHGFVSNSSSSSFVIIGTELKVRDLFDKETNLTALVKTGHLYACGNYTCDGADFFKVDKKMLDLLKTKDFDARLDYYIVHQLIDDYGEIDTTNLPDKVPVFAMEVDYHIVQNVDDLKSRYFPD